MTPPLHLLLSILVGALPPTLALLAIRLYRCRCCSCLGHDWERREIHGAHYRAASEAFRVCKRCGHRELIEELVIAPLPVFWVKRKPRPTHLPSDGRSCER